MNSCLADYSILLIALGGNVFVIGCVAGYVLTLILRD